MGSSVEFIQCCCMHILFYIYMFEICTCICYLSDIDFFNLVNYSSFFHWWFNYVLHKHYLKKHFQQGDIPSKWKKKSFENVYLKICLQIILANSKSLTRSLAFSIILHRFQAFNLAATILHTKNTILPYQWIAAKVIQLQSLSNGLYFFCSKIPVIHWYMILHMYVSYITVRNPLLLCPLVLAQDGGTRSRQKCLHRDFSATVLNFTTEMHQSVGNGMREFCDISKLTITTVDANDLTSRESQC